MQATANPPTVQSLARPEEVKRIVGIYQKVLGHYQALAARAKEAADDLSGLGIRSVGDKCVVSQAKRLTETYVHGNLLQDLRREFWRALISRTGLLSRLDSHQAKIWANKIQQSQTLAVSEENVLIIMQQVIDRWDEVHDQLVVAAFDNLTGNARNNVRRRGKYITNDAYAVGKKVILTRPDYACGYTADRLIDVEKALGYLTGTPFEFQNCMPDLVAVRGRHKHTDSAVDTRFFSVKLYSETIHLKWKDEKLRRRFNARVNEILGPCLPGEIKRK